MAFTRPTLTTLIARARSDIETRLAGAVASLRNSVESVLARIVAGAAHGLHGHLVWLSKQLFPDTAEAEFVERWAAIWGLERTPAVRAVLTADITGDEGKPCPAGAVWATADGISFTQDVTVVIASGVATISITADDGGVDGSLDTGTGISLVSPIASIDSVATISGTTISGADAETDAALAARLLLRLQNTPSGGGPGDYVNWALEVAGVTRAWEIPAGDGLGTVVLYFVRDNDVSIIPDSGEIQEVQDYLDSVAPVVGTVNVYAPTPIDVDITMSVVPNTAAVKAAVEAEIEDLITREATADGCTIYLSWLNEAASIATGETDHTITVPSADLTFTVGQIPVMGTITWS